MRAGTWIHFFRRPRRMVRARQVKLAWAATLLALLALAGFTLSKLQNTSDGSATRDLLLVLLGANLAALVGAGGSGLAWEIRTQGRFDALMRAWMAEETGNILRLKLDQNYTATPTVNGTPRPMKIPLYRLSNEALRALTRSELLASEDVGILHVSLVEVDKFNRFTHLAEDWLGLLLAGGKASPGLVDGVETMCQEIEDLRVKFLDEFENESEFGSSNLGNG